MRTRPTANPPPSVPRRRFSMDVADTGLQISALIAPVFMSDRVSVKDWPSRGGIIVLEYTNPLDFEFLGLDPVNPPLRRDPDQDTWKINIDGDPLGESGMAKPRHWIMGAEFDSEMPTYGNSEVEMDPVIPDSVGQVFLARTMDERCEILKLVGGRFFAKLEDYDGAACLRAWEEKTVGEFGPLAKTQYVDDDCD